MTCSVSGNRVIFSKRAASIWLFCLHVSAFGLVAMLMSGCKKDDLGNTNDAIEMSQQNLDNIYDAIEMSQERCHEWTANLANRRGRPILHVHVHKHAGSYMCQLARKNHEVVPTFPGGYGHCCNIPSTSFQLHLCERSDAMVGVSIEDFKDWKNITYFQTERGLQFGELQKFRDGGYITSLILRPVKDYILSSLVFHGQEPFEVLQWLQHLNKSAPGTFVHDPDNCLYPDNSWVEIRGNRVNKFSFLLQSWATRQLSGNVFTLQTTDDDLRRAKIVVAEHIDVLLDANDIDYELIRDSFQWNQFELDDQNESDDQMLSIVNNSLVEHSLWGPLLAYNHHDVELYRYLQAEIARRRACANS